MSLNKDNFSAIDVDDLVVNDQLDVTDTPIVGLFPAYPQGKDGILADAHGTTRHNAVTYMSMDGNDASDGLTEFTPKATLQACLDTLTLNEKNPGTVLVGPGTFEVSAMIIGQGTRIIGMGTQEFTGTQFNMALDADPGDDMFSSYVNDPSSPGAVHGLVMRDFRTNMRGRGRDVFHFYGETGFSTEFSHIQYLNVNRWFLYMERRPLTFCYDDVNGAICGLGAGTMYNRDVQFEDTGGGAFHLVQSTLDNDWYVGQTVRVTSGTGLPTGLDHLTDYYLVDGGTGALHLSLTPGGAPLPASDAGGSLHYMYGGDAQPKRERVTFEDTGGGNFELVNPVGNYWAVGDVVHFRSNAEIPGGLVGGTDYYLVDDGGDLKVSATPGGAPILATSAGVQHISMQNAYDPNVEGGCIFFNGGLEGLPPHAAASSGLTIMSVRNAQTDYCGRYPYFIAQDNDAGVGTFSFENLETEASSPLGEAIHDAIIGVRGNPGDATAVLILKQFQCHFLGGGGNTGKSFVRQISAGPSTVLLDARGMVWRGNQCDNVLVIGDESLKIDNDETNINYMSGGPTMHHEEDAGDEVIRIAHGADPARFGNGGAPNPSLVILANGTMQWGPGTAVAETGILYDHPTLALIHALASRFAGTAEFNDVATFLTSVIFSESPTFPAVTSFTDVDLDKIQLQEIIGSPAPPASGGCLFVGDNGSGKTQLMIQFKSGAAQQVAIEP